jgi:hypothetical protein
MIYTDFLSQFTDWRPTTLYWQRFSIGEKYGVDEVEEVYNDIFNAAKNDYKLLTELVMILNHKTWQHCEELIDSKFCKTYEDLYYKTRKYALDSLKNDELKYFLDVTD